MRLVPPQWRGRFRARVGAVFLGIQLAVTLVGASESPEVLPAGTVAPDIVFVRIRAQRVEHGRQVPYVKQAGDSVANGIHRFVRRQGKLIGALAGAEGKILFTCDELRGQPLDVGWAARPASYRLVSPDDPRFAHGVTPRAIHRKSRPFDFCRTAEQQAAPQDRFLFLKLPAALQAGKRYAVEFQGGNLSAPQLEFVFDPATLPSDAVHVSQIGFRPDDPVKIAFLSCWMGDGGGLTYEDGLGFSLIDQRSGRSVFEGRARLTRRPGAPQTPVIENHEKTDVWELDFSGFATPGVYRVSVAGIGCSLPFSISGDAWMKAFTVSVRGLYHQRSGIALGPPHTQYRRPRSFHPDDGVKVYHTTYTDPGSEGGFAAIVAGKTDEIVPNAWGGYMDAGDWDRRPIHAYVPRLLLDLYAAAPAKFAALDLNLPESGDDLPDLLNEALWLIDFHQRTQTPEGGIRPGIESAEHPRRGEASWQESLTVMAYAPNATMSYKYAAFAAQAAHLLARLAPARANGYRESALRAFGWAEAQPKAGDSAGAAGERLLAAAEFFRLTGEQTWHDLFLAGTRFREPGAAYSGHNWRTGIYDPQDEAGWVYLHTARPGTDQAIKANFTRALLAHAQTRIDDIAATAFRWVASRKKAVSYSSSVIPDAVALVRAHRITAEVKYLRAAILSCQQGAGANPLNLCYTSGVGVQHHLRMVHEDAYVSHQPLPPGLTVNGPFDPRNAVLARHAGTVKNFRKFVYPSAETWPTLESYFDVGVFSPMSEFTVHRNIAPNAYVWGYLALGR
jgi:endoglucanase